MSLTDPLLAHVYSPPRKGFLGIQPVINRKSKGKHQFNG